MFSQIISYHVLELEQTDLQSSGIRKLFSKNSMPHFAEPNLLPLSEEICRLHTGPTTDLWSMAPTVS